MKPDKGNVYENIHTGKITTIEFRIFFNIAHRNNEYERTNYTHYKTFAKHWKKVSE